MARRHRIIEDEVIPVMRAVFSALEYQYYGNFDEDTVPLFHLLWRFNEHRRGPPAYPEFSREALGNLLTSLNDIRRSSQTVE